MSVRTPLLALVLFAVIATQPVARADASPADSYGARDVHVVVAQKNVPRKRRAVLLGLREALLEGVVQVTGSKSFRRAEKRAGIATKARTRASALEVADKLGADYVVTVWRKKIRRRHTLSVQVLSVAQARRVAVWRIVDGRDARAVGAELGARVLDVVREDQDAPSRGDEPFARNPIRPAPSVPPETVAAAAVAEEAIAQAGFLPGQGPDDLFSLEGAAMAEADFSTIDVPSSGGPLFEVGGMEFTLDARAKFDGFSYFDKNPRVVGENKIGSRAAFDLAAGGLLQGDVFAARARLLFRHDVADRQRRRIEPETLTAAVDLESVKFLAGRTLVTWGRATLFSPMDILCPLDGRDFLAREKLPVWLAEISSGLGPIHADLLILPFFPAPLVDLPQGVGANGRLSSPSRWIDGAFPTASDAGVPITYTFGQGLPRGRLSPDLQVGARLSGSFFGVDGALSYVNQRDPFPSSRAEITTSAAANSIVTTIDYHRRHVFGLDLESTAGRLHLIGEAALVVPSVAFDPVNAGTIPHVSTVVGFDVRSPYFFEDHEVRFFLEAAATLALRGAIPNDPGDPNAILTRGRFPFPLALFARLNYSVGAVTMGLTGISNFAQFAFPRPAGPPAGLDLYLRPEIQVALFHRVLATAAIDYLVGAPGEFFGGFRYNSRFAASLQVQY